MSVPQKEASLEDILAQAGYVPVIHYVGDHTEPACPEGFFLMEWRRLDNPRLQAVVSMNTKAEQLLDYRQVTFKKVPVAGDGILARAANRMFGPAVTLKVSDILAEGDIKNRYLPYGEPEEDRFKKLAHTLHDLTGKLTFFIQAASINSNGVRLVASVYPEVFGKEAVTGPSQFDHMWSTRAVTLDVPSQDHRRSRFMHVHADSLFKVKGDARTLDQEVAINWFNENDNALKVIARHVTGLAALANPSSRRHHVIAPR